MLVLSLSTAAAAEVFAEGVKGSERCECDVGDGGMRSRCGDTSDDKDDESVCDSGVDADPVFRGVL